MSRCRTRCRTNPSLVHYTKAGVLDYVANFRVIEPVMENAKVILLNATNAIVTYEIRYQVASRDGKGLDKVAPRHATTAWALRDGKWWYVYCEASAIGQDSPR